MSGPAVRRAAGDSLLRISQACETLVAGFNSGQTAAARSCMASRDRAISIGVLNSPDLLPPVRETLYSPISVLGVTGFYFTFVVLYGTPFYVPRVLPVMYQISYPTHAVSCQPVGTTPLIPIDRVNPCW